MRNLKEVIRVKEEQIRVLMDQIDKLRAAITILEAEENPLTIAVEPEAPAKHAEAGTITMQKRAWP